MKGSIVHSLGEAMNRRTVLKGLAALVAGSYWMPGCTRKQNEPDVELSPRASIPTNLPITAGRTISRKELETMYSMQPKELVKALNVARKNHGLQIPEVTDHVELANLVRIMYFEEEFFKHNNPKFPEANDLYMYNGFKGIAQVLLNRVRFVNGQLPITDEFLTDYDREKFGKTFDRLYNTGNADNPIKQSNLRKYEWNALWDRPSFFTGGYNSEVWALDKNNQAIIVKKFEQFNIREYSPIDETYIIMKRSTTKLAVKALVDVLLGVSQTDKNDLTKTKIGVGRYNEDPTRFATFYKNDNRTDQWWQGNQPFGTDKYAWFFTGVKLGGHQFYSVGLTESGISELPKAELQNYEKLSLRHKEFHPEDDGRPDRADYGYKDIWVPKGSHVLVMN